MASHLRSYRRFRPVRWLLLLTLIVVGVLLFLGDSALKDRPAFAGYHPSNAIWVFQCDNFPRFWLHAQQTPELRDAIAQQPYLLNRLELETRKAVGIRPTPLRWSVWLGKRLVVAESPDGIGMSLHPGILTRTLAWTYEHTVAPAPISGVYRAGSVFYGWRDGHLIASTALLYVQNALKGTPSRAPQRALRPFEAVCTWGDDLGNQIRFAATDQFPVSGHIQDNFTPRETPLTLTDAWPGSPMFAITTSRWSDVVTAYGEVRSLFAMYDRWPIMESFLALLWQEWNLGTLPPNWEDEAAVGEMAIALLDIDTTQPLPAPEAVMIMRTTTSTTDRRHPFAPLVENLQTIPHEWQEEPGVYAPLLGEKMSLCLGQTETDWVAANTEQAIAHAMSSLKQGETADADLTIRLNWGDLGKAAAGMMAKAAEFELVPGRSKMEVTRDVVPQLESLDPLGELTLVGHYESGRLQFQGLLCRDVESP